VRYCFLILFLAGCTESVDPIIDTGRAYTVYGFLDAHADTQAVRVFAIEGTLDLIKPAPLDVVATSTEIGSGTQHRWQESIVEFANGRYGHVFWANFRGDYDKTYRLVFQRSDNATSSVQVTMPPLATPIRQEPVLWFGYAELPVLWQNAPRLHDIRLTYITNFGTYRFEYPSDPQEVQAEGILVSINLSRDAREIFRDLNRANQSVADLRLREVIMTVLVSSSEWRPPGGVYDPEVLIEPGTLSNVENGFGFVGAGYDAVLVFDPPDSVKIAAGIGVD